MSKIEKSKYLKCIFRQQYVYMSIYTYIQTCHTPMYIDMYLILLDLKISLVFGY